MKTLKYYLNEFVLAIFAGMCISVGGLTYLALGQNVAGAIFFTVGLFFVLIFEFNLFTGKICFALEQKPKYILNLVLIWVGNFVGAFLTSLLFRWTRLESLQEKCALICENKLDDNLLSLFIMGIFCNMLIFFAVFSWKNIDCMWKKVIALFFGVSVFVICGFEHCVADMFYFSFANLLSWEALLKIFIVTLGNVIGGLFFQVVFKISKHNKKNSEE